jgi:hypothetical protein
MNSRKFAKNNALRSTEFIGNSSPSFTMALGWDICAIAEHSKGGISMATVRKSTDDMTSAEWDRLIDAINKLHGTNVAPPAYRTFVKIHTLAMTNAQDMANWRVHTMLDMGMRGVNFLAWHRQFVIRLEQRLQQVGDPSVFIPYWNWIAHPRPPARISEQALLNRWSVDRNFDIDLMPSGADVQAVRNRDRFRAFQSALELGPHASVHNAVGGDMQSAHSPLDPLFYLHHANVDRIWYQWQDDHPAQNPPNMAEVLQPGLVGVPVSSVVDRSNLPYSYA